ncbi:MAG: outer membrane beta-barrel protein [Gammaproteobacteria bacterium]
MNDIFDERRPKWWNAVAVVLAAFAPTSVALADIISDRSTPELQLPAAGSDSLEERVGVRTGALEWYPAVSTALAYDSNLFATDGPRTAEGLSVTEATVALQSDSSSLQTEGAAFLRARRFARTSDQDTTEGGAALRLATPEGLANRVTARLRADRRFESRTDVETPDIRPVSLYDEVRADADYRHVFSRFTLQPSVSAGQIQYGQSSQRFRDRSSYSGELRGAYALTPDFSLVASGRYGRDAFRGSSPFVASANTGAALVGMHVALPEVLELELLGGYFKRRFDHDAGGISGVSLQGALTWYPTRLLTVRSALLREDEPTGLPGALAKVRTEASVELRHEYSRAFDLFVRGKRVTDDFKVVQRKDKAFAGEAGAQYRITSHWHVEFEYDYAARDTAQLGSSFSRHVVSLAFIGRL